MLRELWLLRHGETEWSLSGAHTGRTDLPLTAAGRENAAALGRFLAGKRFGLVLSSPLERARETCRLAGYGETVEIDPNLREWDYGDYEGRTTSEIQKDRPGWSLWISGVPHGETVEQVGARAESVIARALAAEGDVALFAHGHVLRILAARWLGLPPDAGRLFALGTASVSTARLRARHARDHPLESFGLGVTRATRERFGPGRHLHHLADQLQRFNGRDHAGQVAVGIPAREHGHLAGWREDLQHANSLRAVLKQHHQFLVVFQRLLQRVDLPEDDAANVIGSRRRGRLLGGRGQQSLLRNLLGQISQSHTGLMLTRVIASVGRRTELAWGCP